MESIVKRNDLNVCCLKNFVFNDSVDKCVILKLSNPVPVNTNESCKIYGRKLIITSTVNKKDHKEEVFYSSNFKINDQMCFQNHKEEICESDGTQQNVKIV